MEYTIILTSIRKILRSLNIESKKIQKDYGVSIPQLMCLEYLGGLPDFRATHASIAKQLNLNSSTISGILERLEQKGYIAKLPNPSDKRSLFISLTAKGANLLKSSPQLLHERLSRKLKSLPKEKVDNIVSALETLVECFDISEINASPIITLEDPIVPENLKSK